MMIKRTIAIIASTMLGASLSAEWQLVDDFEDGDTEGWEVTTIETPTEVPALRVVDDPAGQGQGKVLEVFTGVASDGVVRGNYRFLLPESMWINDLFPAENNTGTLYLKVMQPLVSGTPGITNMTFGMASAAFLATLDPPKALPDWSFGDYSVLARMFNNNLDYHDGTGYQPLDVSTASPSDAIPISFTYYEYWFVVDRNAQTIDGYIRGGQWAEQTKVWEGAQHRTNPAGAPIDSVYMRSANDGITWIDWPYFDDFYIDNSGVANLTTPGGATGGPSNELINISTRGLVGLADEIMVGGFVSQGEAAGGTILVRGIGPTLGGFGVANTVEDPVIRVFDGTGTMIAENDDWGDDADVAAAAEAVGAFALEAGSTDAAMLMTGLAPGAYTVQLSGKGTTAQNGLLEVYKVE